MKTTTFVLLLLASACCEGLAQIVHFNNTVLSAPPDRLVRNTNGAALFGTNYAAQLLYGAGPGSLTAHPATALFRSSATNLTGTWQGGNRTLTGFTGGQGVTLMVRVWNTAFGATYETARASGGGYGESLPFSYQIPTSNTNVASQYYMSNFAGFYLAGPPFIQNQPQSRTVPAGSAVTNSVMAVGATPLSYQWRYNGGSIPDATNSTLVLPNVQFATSGDFQVIVTNLYGATTSAVATLTVFVPTSLAITEVSDVVRIVISGTPNDTMTVESSTDLFTWSIVGGITLDNTGTAESVSSVGVAQRYYRTRGEGGGGGVYSVNIVGYISVAVPAQGDIFLSNPFLRSNTIAAAMPDVPNGLVVMKVGTSGFSANNYLDGWSSSSMTALPGEGFLVRNPSSSPVALTFYGEVTGGSNHLPAGWALCSSVLPPGGLLEFSLGFPVADGDLVYLFNAATASFDTYEYLDGIGWNPTEPALGAGQAFWAVKSAPAIWSRFFEGVAGNYAVTNFAATSTVAQVNFLTYNTSSNLGRIFGMDAVTPAGTNVLVQLYAGTNANSVNTKIGVPVAVSGSSAGYVRGGVVNFSNAVAGQTIYLRVRAWNVAAGATYEAAVASGGARGESAVFSTFAGGGPNVFPPEANNFASFALGFPPVVVAQPYSQTVTVGANAQFSAGAAGSLPLSFRWRRNVTTLTNSVLNASTSIYAINNVQTNNAGNYTVIITNRVGSVTSSVAVLTVLADADGDRIPDAWEFAYGLNPNSASDASQDFDGDGMTNLEEYRAGTDPVDAASYLRINSITVSGSSSLLQFLARSNVLYALEYTDVLSPPVWTLLAEIPPAPTNRVVSGADGTANSSRYYRLLARRSMADPPVYSVNTLGYVNITVSPGTNIINRPLLNAAPDNTVATMLPNPPEGTCIFKWNPAIQAYEVACYFDGAWDNPNLVVNPGQTFELHNPGSAYTLSFVGEVVPAPPECVPPPPGLVSWWPMEGQVRDIISSNQPSAVSGHSFVPAQSGSGLSLTTGGYVEIPHTANLANQRFTFAAWVRPNGIGPNDDLYGSIILSKGRDGSFYYQLSWNSSGQFVFGTGPQSGGTILSAANFPAGHYYFVVGTYDGGNFRLYVNGAPQGERTSSEVLDYSGSIPWTIGSAATVYHPSFRRTWNGVIDEVAIFNRALSSNEIAAIYAAGSAGKCPPQTVSVFVQGNGSIELNPPGGAYSLGSVVTLTPIPAPYHEFLRWSDGDTNSPRTITVGISNSYTAIFINVVGAPVILVNGESNNVFVVTNAATVEIQSTYSGARIYFTLDGSDPDNGELYSGPFVLSNSAVVRAVAYTPDYLGAAEADPVTISVVSGPVILLQPQSLVIAAGDALTLRVVAEGDPPLTYQWRFNGVNIVGANGPVFMRSNVEVFHAGSYSVLVSNPYGSALSADANTVVRRPPTVAPQPASATVERGTNVMFCIGVDGDGPFRFQWRKNGVNIRGATSQCYSITNVQVADGGSYSVVVQNDVGAAISESAVLTVTLPPLAGGDTFATRIDIGTNICFAGTNFGATREFGEPRHAGKTGGRSIWYSWQAPFTGIASFETVGSSFDTLLAVYTGSNVANLTLVAADEDGAGFLSSRVQFNALAGVQYQIAVDGYDGAEGTFTICRTVEVAPAPLPSITLHPTNDTVRSGEPVAFVVAASNAVGNVTWYFNSAVLSNQHGTTLTIPNVLPEHVGFYRAAFSNAFGGVAFTDTAVLEIGPVRGVQSVDKLPDLAVDPASFGRIRRLAAVSTGVGISVGAGTIESQVINNTGSATSSTEPLPCEIVGGASRWLLLLPTNTATMRIDTLGSTIDTVLGILTGNSPGSAVPFLCDDDSAPNGRSLVQFTAQQGAGYYVQADGKSGTNGTIKINISFGFAPTNHQASQSYAMLQGDDLTLASSATGTPAPTLEWLHQIAGALVTRPSTAAGVLALSNLQPADAGVYFLVASNALGVITNQVAVVTVQTNAFAAAEASFDLDAAPWMALAGVSNLLHRTSGGNPGGFLVVTGATTAWRIVAPEEYLGNKFHAYDGLLNFDLLNSLALSGAYVQLHGEERTLRLDLPALQGPGVFNFKVLLNETLGWWTSVLVTKTNVRASTNLLDEIGAPATSGQFVSVLSALQSIEIAGGALPAGATVGVDNVSLLLPNVPLLSLRAEGGQWLIEWPVALGESGVEISTDLTNWGSPAPPSETNNRLQGLRLGPESGQRFFRLKR